MSETLSEKRQRFTHDVALLILQAEKLGYQAALDQVKRTQAEADANAASGAGIRNSLHLIGLACDLLLYQGGRYLMASSDYKLLGDWWKALGDGHCWGGDFKDKVGNAKPDGNHFSIEDGGIR